MITFGKLSFLFMSWLIPFFIVFSVWALRKRKQLIEKFAGSALESRLVRGVTHSTYKVKAVMVVGAVFFILCALIGPRWGFHWEEVKRRGSDIIIAVDVSKSMLAQDITPSRLERARREIIDLLHILKGDRVGLVVFSGTSFSYCPLTLDYSAVRLFLDGLNPELISQPGTAISQAIMTALDSFTEGDVKSQAIILITDGEDHEGQPLKAAQKAKDKGVRIYTIGMGKLEGAPIPDKQDGSFIKNEHGEIVLSRLDETTLQRIAITTGGAYARSVTGDLDLESIYKALQKDVNTKELTGGAIKRYEERFQWFLAAAFLLIVLEALLFKNYRASMRKNVPFSHRKNITSAVIFLALSLVLFTTSNAESFIDRAKKGKQFYEEEKYDEALSYYLDKQIDTPDDLAFKYNSANAYYKLKKYEEAEKLFSASAQSEDKELSQKSYYNLGNTSYRLGKLEEAVQHYRKAIDEARELNSEDKDAQHNLDFVLKELEKQKQEQKQQQSSDDSDKSQKQDEQNQSQDDNSQQQDKEQQDSSQNNTQQDGEDTENNKDDRGEKSEEQPQDRSDNGKEEQNKDDTTPEGQKEAEKQNKDSTEQDKESPLDGTEQEQMDMSSEQFAESMTEEEASRWLSILKEERPPVGEKTQRGAVRYPKKDW